MFQIIMWGLAGVLGLLLLLILNYFSFSGDAFGKVVAILNNLVLIAAFAIGGSNAWPGALIVYSIFAFLGGMFSLLMLGMTSGGQIDAF